MGIKDRIIKVAGASLAGGAIIIGGLGLAAPAFADGGQAANAGPPAASRQAPPAQAPGSSTQRGRMDTSFIKTDLQTVAARKIGISVEALRQEMARGGSIAQVAARHGVTYADLKTTLVDSAGADLQNATAAGAVTQTQANQLVSNIPQMVERIIGSATAANANARGVTSGSNASAPAGNQPNTQGQTGSNRAPTGPQSARMRMNNR